MEILALYLIVIAVFLGGVYFWAHRNPPPKTDSDAFWEGFYAGVADEMHATLTLNPNPSKSTAHASWNKGYAEGVTWMARGG